MKDVWPKVEKAGLKEIQVSKSKGQRSRTQQNTGQEMLRNHLLQNLNAHSNLLVSDNCDTMATSTSQISFG